MAMRGSHPSGSHLLAIYIALFVVATITVVLRLCVRSARGQKSGADDSLIIVAWLLAAAIFVTTVVGCNAGWGMHIWEISKSQLSESLKAQYVFAVLYNFAVLATRTSMLLFYRRINPNRTFRLIADISIGVCAAGSIAFAFPSIFACRPIAFFWNFALRGRCTNIRLRMLINGVLGLVLDVFILVFPVPMVLKLRVSIKQKLGLCVLFTIGICTCVTAAIRLPALSKLHTKDPLWEGVFAGIYSYAEISCSIICASLPTLRSYFAKRTTTESQANPMSHSSSSAWSESKSPVSGPHRHLPKKTCFAGLPLSREKTGNVMMPEDLEAQVLTDAMKLNSGIKVDTNIMIRESRRSPSPLKWTHVEKDNRQNN